MTIVRQVCNKLVALLITGRFTFRYLWVRFLILAWHCCHVCAYPISPSSFAMFSKITQFEQLCPTDFGRSPVPTSYERPRFFSAPASCHRSTVVQSAPQHVHTVTSASARYREKGVLSKDRMTTQRRRKLFDIGQAKNIVVRLRHIM